MTQIQSAKLNGRDPYAYLKDVLIRLPTPLISYYRKTGRRRSVARCGGWTFTYVVPVSQENLPDTMLSLISKNDMPEPVNAGCYWEKDVGKYDVVA
jgi:hypothetical protein